jgi:hypothetical protein
MQMSLHYPYNFTKHLRNLYVLRFMDKCHRLVPLYPGMTQIQDGGHFGWAAELIIERNLPLVTPNKPQKNWINRPRYLSYNWRKPNVHGHRCLRRIGHDIMQRSMQTLFKQSTLSRRVKISCPPRIRHIITQGVITVHQEIISPLSCRGYRVRLQITPAKDGKCQEFTQMTVLFNSF